MALAMSCFWDDLSPPSKSNVVHELQPDKATPGNLVGGLYTAVEVVNSGLNVVNERLNAVF